MGHRLIVTVAAVSVLFHVLMGCCAHHAHASPCCHPHTDEGSDGSRACCNQAAHPHGGPPHNDRCPVGSEIKSVADGLHYHVPDRCPGEGSSPCAEQSCSFSIPESPTVSVLDDSAGLIVAVLELRLGSQPLVPASAANGSARNHAPFWVGALRHHLALSVLLI